jgi:hypothetical protein
VGTCDSGRRSVTRVSRWRVACAALALALPPPLACGERLLGIGFSGVETSRIAYLGRDDLLGALKMSGIWVSKLGFDAYVRESLRFCRYAAERGQAAYLQIPRAFDVQQVGAALDRLAAAGCRPAGFSIGNEVDRLVVEKLASRYSVADYIADYNRIVPVVAARFPDAVIIALELSAFMAPHFRERDPLAVKYRPIFDWLLPFARAKLVRRPDFVSVHYYPFTGAQKEWETLDASRMLRKALAELEPHLGDLPPLLVGEFNVTYQYEQDTSYPGSGGESFMAALAVPGLLAIGRVAGLFHWSLYEAPPSTLSLHRGQAEGPVPLYHAYRMMGRVADHRPVAIATPAPGVEEFVFEKDGRRRSFVVNESAIFRRDVALSTGSTVTLPPLSITDVAGATRLSHADRVPSSGPPSAPERSRLHCARLADFSEHPKAGGHFENAAYNQNRKIATGGTYIALASPGGRVQANLEESALRLSCRLPGPGPRYHQCGVKLPLVTDAKMDRGEGVDWAEAHETGRVRITVASEAPVELELHLEDFRPEAVGFNSHRAVINVDGHRTLDVPLRDFRQAAGFGIVRPLPEILRNAADLRVEVRRPGFSGAFRVHRLEICDAR